jgi:hypothetical protein
MANNYKALISKISGVIIGMAVFFSLGIAMSYASVKTSEHTVPEVSKVIHISSMLGVSQVRY